MSNQIKVNYEEVYNKTAELRQHITRELRDASTCYRQAGNQLRGMDGSANAEMIHSMQFSLQKSQVTADTLTKLLMFIDTSTRQIERGEQNIARAFESSQIRKDRKARI
jgi:hypothetical protein